MELIIEKNKGDAVKKAALMIAKFIKKKPDAVLEIATGSTMIPLYRELVRLYKKGEIDFSEVSTFNLDEYADIQFNNPESYHYYMNKNLFDKVNIKKHNTHFPSYHGKLYDKEIKDVGGIDLGILGIGVNGHIAFNEPGSSFNSKTREVKLSNNTIKANSRLFPSIKKVPKDAYTVGIETIMESRKIILLAFGSKKADAIFSAVKEPITIKSPASILRKHKDAVFILDKKAARRL